MTPQTTYYVKVSVTDNNTLDDVTTVKVTLKFYAADASPSGDPTGEAADTQTLVHLTWTDTPSWAIDPNTSTSWALVEGSCSPPSDMSVNSDAWIFAVTPGKVATESITPADWDIHARATDDDTATDGMYCRDKGMNWYGEIKDVTPTVGFGSVALGCVDSQSTSALSATYIANGPYDVQVKADAFWSGASTVNLNGSGSPGPGEFSLKADDDPCLVCAVQVTTTYATFDSGIITGESGNVEANNYLWLSLGSSGIPDYTYSGTIYYRIVNG
jgi:hypothetical protein